MMCPDKEAGVYIRTWVKKILVDKNTSSMIGELLGSVICDRKKPLQCFLHFSFDLRDSELHEHSE